MGTVSGGLGLGELESGGTYDGEGPDDFAGWLDVGRDDLRDEVGGHAEDCDHGYERETADENKRLGQWGGAVIWDRHLGCVVLSWVMEVVYIDVSLCRDVVVIPASG